MKRRLNSIVSLVATAILLLAGLNSAGAVVLCLGFDGHVRVEAAIEGFCVSDSETGFEEEAILHEVACTVRHGRGDCGPCLDIPLGAGVGYRAKEFVAAPKIDTKSSVSPSLRATYSVLVAHRPSFDLASSRSMGSASAVCLRSVTLLI